MKLLAISGSARRDSTNTALLMAVKSLALAGVDVSVFHRLDTLPVFSPDLEGERTPAVVLDSHSLVPILRDPAKERGQREAMFMYGGCQLHAVRLGEWKAHYVTAAPMGKPQNRCCQAC